MEAKQGTGAAGSRQRTRSRARRDKGKRLITARDRLVLAWIAQQYAARLDQVRALLNRAPGRGGKAQVVGRWVDLGLVSYERVYQREPGWIYLTALGLRRNELMRSIGCKKCWRRPM